MQNFPNPFNPETKINYELPIANYVTLKVYDMTGKEIMTLVNENQTQEDIQRHSMDQTLQAECTFIRSQVNYI
ncbi:MAG: T9SS type A sorting domain-containing protein [Ignavibacteria bacterium]|nr:T9SS type A sorting domain-containing protein [Ignavibacteria bacterium]